MQKWPTAIAAGTVFECQNGLMQKCIFAQAIAMFFTK
jgi:hypothetical protein